MSEEHRNVKELENAYVRVNPQEVYEMLMKKIKEEVKHVTEDLKKEEWQKRLRISTLRISEYISYLSEPYLSSLLGVVYPSMGADKVFVDRMTQLCKLAEGLVNEIQDKLEAKLIAMMEQDRELTLHEKREILEDVVNLLSTIIFVQIAVSEVANRFLTVMTMNTRPDTRPPLVNALFGYDKL